MVAFNVAGPKRTVLVFKAKVARNASKSIVCLCSSGGFRVMSDDRRWWVSHIVVRYEEVRFQQSQRPPTASNLDQNIEMAIPIPDAICRAAAGACSD